MDEVQFKNNGKEIPHAEEISFVFLPRLLVSEYRTRAGAPALHMHLLRRDSQSFHLAVEVAAFESQHLRGAAHVAVVLVEFFQDVITFIGVASFVQ